MQFGIRVMLDLVMLFGLGFGALQQTEKYFLSGERIVVNGLSGGKSYVFALSFESDVSATAVNAVSMGHTVRIGDVALHDLKLVRTPMPGGCDGYLGRDVLSKYGIGFDTVDGTLTLLPRNTLSESFERKWVCVGDNWKPSGSGASRIVPINVGPADAPYINATIEGKSQKMFLFAGYHTTVSSAVAGRQESFDGPVFCPARARLSDGRNRWMLMPGGMDSDLKQSPGLDGAFSIENFWSPRLIVDLAHYRVCYEELSTWDTETKILAEFLRFPVAVIDGKLRVGGPLMRMWPAESDQVKGMEVEELAGFSGSAIVAMMEEPNEENVKNLEELARQTYGEYVCKLVNAQGQEQDVTVPASRKWAQRLPVKAGAPATVSIR